MYEEVVQRLHKRLAQFVADEGINPTNIQITFAPTKAVVVLDILPKVPDEDRKLVD